MTDERHPPEDAAARSDRTRAQVLDWVDRGHVEAARVPAALALAAPPPDGATWRRFLVALALSLGALLVAAGVIFFFAYNWSGLGRLGKLALVQSALLIAVAAVGWQGFDTAIGRAALVAASLLVGATLAVFGQVYQTGADPWQLFAVWAAIVTPWALAGREPWLWLLWIALIDTALVLHLEREREWFAFAFEPDAVLWPLFVANGLALIVWEGLADAALPWLRAPWARRLLVLAAGVPITTLLVLWVVGAGTTRPYALIAWLAWMGALHFRYRRHRPDLFVLAAGVLAVIVVVTTALAFHTTGGPAPGGAFLLIVVAIVTLSTGGAVWLRRVAAELDGQVR